jgi:hypothetical protein
MAGMRKVVVASAIVALTTGVLTGCSPSLTTEDPEATSEAPASPWPVATPTKPPPDPCADPAASVPTGFAQFSNADIKAALEKAPLPPGVVVMNETDLFSIMKRSMIDVVVRICKPDLVGDPLKDVASTIATAIARSPAGGTVVSLRVTNTAAAGDPQGKVKVEDFQNYSWASKPPARAVWKYSNEE